MIDGHVNITHDGKWFHTAHDASLGRLLGEMEEAGIGRCLLISMPGATTNRYIASVLDKCPEKFKGFGHIDFSANLIKELEEIVAMGFTGVKIHPRLQGVDCNCEELSPVFSYLDDRGMPVMIDGYYQTKHVHPCLDSLTPFQYDRLAKKYKNISFILSHAGAHRAFDAYFLSKSNGNVYLDISHVLLYFKGTSLIQDYLWIMEKLDEKIIYGSDFPEYPMKKYLDEFGAVISKSADYRKIRDNMLTNLDKVLSGKERR